MKQGWDQMGGLSNELSLLAKSMSRDHNRSQLFIHILLENDVANSGGKGTLWRSWMNPVSFTLLIIVKEILPSGHNEITPSMVVLCESHNPGCPARWLPVFLQKPGDYICRRSFFLHLNRSIAQEAIVELPIPITIDKASGRHLW